MSRQMRLGLLLLLVLLLLVMLLLHLVLLVLLVMVQLLLGLLLVLLGVVMVRGRQRGGRVRRQLVAATGGQVGGHVGGVDYRRSYHGRRRWSYMRWGEAVERLEDVGWAIAEAHAARKINTAGGFLAFAFL